MAQRFPPHANVLARAVLLVLAVGAAVLLSGGFLFVHSDGFTGEGRVVEQPVPFSHAHHVGGLGIGCRYCHAGTERAPVAGMPSTETCMTCHSQLWTEAEMLRPVRASLRLDRPLRWNRLHDLADYVYFDHSVHAAQGVGCETCHGRVDRMPLTRQAAPLTMDWCLECHRDPAPRLRPPDAVYAMGWQPPEGQSRRAVGAAVMRARGIRTAGLTDCWVCHR
ncbi:cytochrome c3 family protein [Minwuia thermotolerans]|uniref:Cytochrome C n=1 Tax=Minwuia thermotolerans TaxID=2056226 RepID=A0A2M9G307_9PROT|nr:cytochrome c3 family protein [Minwuia thermotolerans]PJK30102.1 cytochrome C [Minwuia thermotolerans]